RLQCERSDEFLRVGGHEHVTLPPFLDQLPDDLRGFVRGDPAGHAEGDPGSRLGPRGRAALVRPRGASLSVPTQARRPSARPLRRSRWSPRPPPPRSATTPGTGRSCTPPCPRCLPAYPN